jgi:hypothetical protein
MNDQQIRKIVREEIKRANSSSRFRLQSIPEHTQNLANNVTPHSVIAYGNIGRGATPIMNDQQITKIVREEIQRANNSSRFRLQSIPEHTHNGTDSPRVADENLGRNPAIFGRVSFSTSGVDYIFELNLPYTPRQVVLNGTLVDSTTSPTVRYNIWGTAYLGPAYYLQPVDNRTVTAKGLSYPAPTPLQGGSEATIPAQSSTFFGFVNGANAATAGDSQFHIVNVFGSAVMRVTVVDFSKDKLVFRVTSLTSGYTLLGNYTIL